MIPPFGKPVKKFQSGTTKIINTYPKDIKQFFIFKFFFMSSILYLVAVILVIGWAVGVFAYSAGGLIHALLVIAVIAIIYNLVTGKKVV